MSPSGGVSSPNRLMSALLKGRSHANALPATYQVRLPVALALGHLGQLRDQRRHVLDLHHQVTPIPDRTAQAAASVRLDIPSLARMFDTCTPAVRGEM